MCGKVIKRFGKRITAISLSLILAVVMFWGNCLLEVKASDNVSGPYMVTDTLYLTIVGYEGEGTPEFGKVVLRLYKDRNNSDSYDDIREEQMIQSGSGTELTYTCTYEGGKYYGVEWGIDAGQGYTKLCNHMTTGSLIGEHENANYNMNGRAYRYRFMDGSAVYHEQYALSTYQLYNINNPQKNDHTFLGWKEGEESNKILSLSEIKAHWTYRTITYYAVWDHPAEDTWAWNNDNDSHWHECSCGELKTAAEAHTWDDGVITRQPADTVEGEKTYTCTDGCGRTKTEPIPATGKPTVSGNDSISGNDPTLPDDPGTPGNSDIPTNMPDAGTNNVNTGNTVNNGTPVKAVANVSTTSTKNKEPKTGGVPYIEIYATVAMIAGMAYLLLYFYDDKRGMSEIEKKELMTQLIAWAKKGGYFRRIVALTAIFFLLCYYHSIGKQSQTQWKTT